MTNFQAGISGLALGTFLVFSAIVVEAFIDHYETPTPFTYGDPKVITPQTGEEWTPVPEVLPPSSVFN